MKLVLFLLIFFASISVFVIAHSDHEEHTSAEVGQALVESDISCKLMDKDDILAVGTYLYNDKGPAWWLRLRARLGYCMRH